jgi:hypothetical protein
MTSACILTVPGTHEDYRRLQFTRLNLQMCLHRNYLRRFLVLL